MSRLKKDLTGRRFGKLTVIEIHSRARSKHIRWHCICDCGKFADVLSTHLLSSSTRSCGCNKKYGKEHKQWKGYKGISGQYWNTIQRNADGSKNRRTLSFNITKKYMWNMLEKQQHKCALSGLPIKLPDRYKQTFTASIDRIDSSKGYVKGNVQWVHKDINMMKRNLNQARFVEFCLAVASTCGGEIK